jgi:hypothetical protein
MTQVPGRTARSTKDYSIHQRGTTNPRSKRQHHHIPAATGCAPQYFGNQRRAGVILGADRYIPCGDHLTQYLPFQEVQVSRQALHSGCGGIDDAFAANAYSPYRSMDASQNGLNKISKGCGGAR